MNPTLRLPDVVTSDAYQLLSSTLDTSGYIVIVGLKTDRPPIQRFFAPSEYKAACAEAMRLDANEYNAYFATTTFKNTSSRKADNANAIKTFKIDLDVAPDEIRKYPSKNAAVAALAHFVDSTVFPVPILVDSGWGVHGYWTMREALSPEEGKLYSEKLKAALLAHGLKCDPTVTADSARILRVPGTHNYKVEGHVKPVVLKGGILIHDTDDMLDHIDRICDEKKLRAPAINTFNVAQPASELIPCMAMPAHLIGVPLDATTKSLLEGKPKNFAVLVKRSADKFTSPTKGCAQVADIVEHQASTPEDRWRAGLSIAKFCNDGDDAIHEMSKEHNDYDRAATNAKADLILGPYTCQTFMSNWPEHCEGCPHKGKIKSPIVLGMEDVNFDFSSDGKTTEDLFALNRLAGLSKLEYDRVRNEEAKILGVRTSTLDGMVAEIRAGREETRNSPFIDVEPWDQAIDVAELLTDISATVQRYIVCEAEVAHAAALWTAMTWVVDALQIAPLAIVTAPEKRCGKSEFRRLMAKLVNRPLEADGMSASVLFRGFDLWKPTLLVDEFDTFVTDDEDLRGIFNAGHQRGGCIWRCVGDDHEPRRFDVFGPKLLAGIGKLPSTMMDRAIIFELRRKLAHEQVERLRYADQAHFDMLQRKLARFAQDHLETIRSARPALPDVLNDRQQDNWEPLFAIAFTAGGDWPGLVKRAALKLSADTDSSTSIATELLQDIQDIFATQGVKSMFSSKLVSILGADEDKRWATHYRGKPITPNQVAGKLKGFGIAPKNVRIAAAQAKGYEVAQFSDAFKRYLPQATEITALIECRDA